MLEIPRWLSGAFYIKDDDLSAVLKASVRVSIWDIYLHPDDSIDEEEHHYQQSDVWQGLQNNMAVIVMLTQWLSRHVMMDWSSA